MRTLEEHPNTVKLFDVYDQSDTFVLVMELCSGEDHVEGGVQDICLVEVNQAHAP